MLLHPVCKVKGGYVKNPREEYCSKLSTAKLIGKMQFKASMTESEIRKESYVFSIPMVTYRKSHHG